jgi:hypothetical protein
MLYVVNLSLSSDEPVASHRLRQTTLCTPEAFGSVHAKPSDPATSFRPLK